MSSEDSRSPEAKIMCKGRAAAYSYLWQNDLLSDFIIVVDGREIKVHGFVLISFGPVFLKMVESGLKETSSHKIEIKDYAHNVVHSMLEYMYTAVFTDEMAKIASELISIATKYFIDALKSKCAKSLANKLCNNNALEMLVLADKYADESLIDASLKFIKRNYEAIRGGGQWAIFNSTHGNLVVKILDHTLHYSPNKKQKLND